MVSRYETINFTTNQSIVGDSEYNIVGSDSSLSAVTFAYDDSITMAVALSTFRLYHSGTNGTTATIIFEVSYYNGAGDAQAYAE